MAKLKNCKSCGNEVAKGAKMCPHCGAKLKMGKFAKFLIVCGALIGTGILLAPSAQEKQAALVAKLDAVENAKVISVPATGLLPDMFNLFSDYTDLQRDNKVGELKGSFVEWSLPVYEVELLNADEKLYRIQTRSGKFVGTFIKLYARNQKEQEYIDNIQTDNFITVKGKIAGSSLRHIEIEDAILIDFKS